MFFITIIDFNLKAISHQIDGKIAAHMTEANNADPLNGRLHCFLPKAPAYNHKLQQMFELQQVFATAK
jgi:hypothetical protein